MNVKSFLAKKKDESKKLMKHLQVYKTINFINEQSKRIVTNHEVLEFEC